MVRGHSCIGHILSICSDSLGITSLNTRSILACHSIEELWRRTHSLCKRVEHLNILQVTIVALCSVVKTSLSSYSQPISNAERETHLTLECHRATLKAHIHRVRETLLTLCCLHTYAKRNLREHALKRCQTLVVLCSTSSAANSERCHNRPTLFLPHKVKARNHWREGLTNKLLSRVAGIICIVCKRCKS